ncbi:hypothetical protein CRENBAI_008674 [Crenichthys baileyi]|uniref:Uncharacterized protein n=1 Tax=Crenichthys baileyi TaxID=28760 RepID=A0AAV9RSS2_9TELE
MSDDSSVAVSGDSSLASSDSSDAAVIVHTNGGTRTHAEREVAKEEHFYDQQSGSGYLAWRIKTVERSSAAPTRRSSTSTAHQDGPKRKR